MRNDHDPEAFVARVRAALFGLDEQRYQDQLDLLLLGETVPAEPIPQPDPDCSDCWGAGRVCPCHGVCAAHGASQDWRVAMRSSANTEICDCVKRQRRRR